MGQTLSKSKLYPPTPKQLEKRKIREQKIMKELYESDFHEITWDKKCV